MSNTLFGIDLGTSNIKIYNQSTNQVINEKNVIAIINKKDFKKKENGAVILTDDARKKVITEWQNKKKETITHPYLKEKVEWGLVPYIQAMLLARYLRGDLDGYPPLFWK